MVEQLDIASWEVPLVTRFVRARMDARVDAVKLFPGVHEAIEDLAARGVGIAIVSGDGEASVRRVLGHRLASLVHDYRCDVSMFGKRPRLRQVLAAGGVEPSRALVIGDELRDLRAARAEGLAFGGVAWGCAPADALRAAAPEHMFERVEEIPPALLGATRPLPA